MPKLNKKNKKLDCFYNNGMLYRRNPSWSQDADNGRYDALWRTSLGYIAYKDDDLYSSIMLCYKPTQKGNSLYYQPMREKGGYGIENCSRDQVIMSLTALNINNPYWCDNIASALRFRISKRSFMTPDMWLWVKYLAGSKLSAYLYCLINIPILLISASWNFLARRLLGFRDVQQKYYDSGIQLQKRNNFNKFQKILYKTITPPFSYHLTSWMVYCLPDIKLKKALNWILRKGIEKDNLLLQMLNGKKITKKQIDNYQPMIGTFRWQTRLDGSSSMYIKIPDKQERVKANCLDKDILITIYNNG